MNMNAIVWLATGIGLMLAELALPGFVVFFFGLGALITGILLQVGVIESFAMQLLVFVITSVGSLFVFRKKWSTYFKGDVSGKMQPGEVFEDITGKKVKVIAEIIPGQIAGKVEYNGTVWEAESDEIIETGEIVQIVSRSNLRLKVKR